MARKYQPKKPDSTPTNYMYKPFLDLVVDPANWKNPIDATIDVPKDAEERKLFFRLINDAVIFFCGCVPEFINVGDHQVRVVAAGYYASVGA